MYLCLCLRLSVFVLKEEDAKEDAATCTQELAPDRRTFVFVCIFVFVFLSVFVFVFVLVLKKEDAKEDGATCKQELTLDRRKGNRGEPQEHR